jgi:hypothetical protein
MKNISFVFFILFFLIYNIAVSQSDSLFITEPEKYVAEGIFTHRITMFGEGIQHHNPVTFFNFVTILNRWLNMVKENTDLNPNLTVIIECDSATVNIMNEYIKTGKLRPVLDVVAPAFPLEDLELLYEYRKIYLEAEKENLSRSKKINFCLKGFEEIGYNVKESYFNMNEEEHELWFINERDRYTSQGIIKYLNNNPGQRALIFYGSAHLQTGIVNKRIGGFSIPDEKSFGKWIAQYLIDEYGENELNIVVSTALDNYSLSRPAFDKVDTLPFIITMPLTEFAALNLKGVNKYFVNKQLYAPMHDVNFAMSRYIIERAIEKAHIFEAFKGYKAGSGQTAIFYLNFLYDKKFKNSDDIKKWYDGKGFQGFSVFDSVSFYNHIFAYYLKSSDWYGGKNMLQQLGFNPAIMDYRSTSKKDWDEKIWPANLNNIKFINAIEIFWVGYPDEQKTAKEYLKQFSGKDFDEPAEYLQWWRREYSKYKF